MLLNLSKGGLISKILLEAPRHSDAATFERESPAIRSGLSQRNTHDDVVANFLNTDGGSLGTLTPSLVGVAPH